MITLRRLKEIERDFNKDVAKDILKDISNIKYVVLVPVFNSKILLVGYKDKIVTYANVGGTILKGERINMRDIRDSVIDGRVLFPDVRLITATAQMLSLDEGVVYLDERTVFNVVYECVLQNSGNALVYYSNKEYGTFYIENKKLKQRGVFKIGRKKYKYKFSMDIEDINKICDADIVKAYNNILVFL